MQRRNNVKNAKFAQGVIAKKIEKKEKL
jgi:hypothetical protein